MLQQQRACVVPHPEDVVNGGQAVDSVLDLEVKRGTRQCLDCTVDWRVSVDSPCDCLGDSKARVCPQSQQLEDSCQGCPGHRNLEVARVEQSATTRSLGAEVDIVGSQGRRRLCRCHTLKSGYPLSSKIDGGDARRTTQGMGSASIQFVLIYMASIWGYNICQKGRG